VCVVVVVLWVPAPLLEGAVVVVVGAVVVETGAHDSDTDAIGRLTGREIDDNGVPGGTLTVKDCLAPPTKVTVITQESAEAVGIAAMPSVASTVSAPTTSFRPVNTLVTLLPPFRRASRLRRARMAAFAGRYWLTPGFATVNCSFRTSRIVLRRQASDFRGILGVHGPSSTRAYANYRRTDRRTVAGRTDQRMHCSPGGKMVLRRGATGRGGPREPALRHI
jgi:hypothetical protein